MRTIARPMIVASQPTTAEPEAMDSEDLLYLLYTSGTTAKPKGIMHTTAGYLVGTATTHRYIFDIKPEDIYWCMADIGWVTGHSYIVYGPLANATTGVIYEGAIDFPDKNRWAQIAARLGVTILYTAPTAIRALMKYGADAFAGDDLSSLRLLGSANHDPAVYPDHPERLDIRRPNVKPLSFGGGIHFCLGAQLARIEAEVAISTLLRRLPDLRLDDAVNPEWRPTFVLRGLKRLPASW